MVRKKMVVVDLEKIEWEPVEHPKVPKGMWAKLLSHDEETGARPCLLG